MGRKKGRQRAPRTAAPGAAPVKAAKSSREPLSALAVVLGLTLFLAPLVLDLFSTDEYETPKLLLLRVMAGLLFGAWCLDAVRIGMPSLRDRRLWPLAAFFLATVLATLGSSSPSVSLVGEYGSYAGLQSQSLYLLIALAAFSLPRPGDIKLVLIFHLFGVIPSTGMGLLEAAGHEVGTFFGLSADIPAHSTSGFFGNPNYFAGYTVSILPTAIYFLRDPRHWLKTVALMVAVGSGVAVVLSGSRTGIGFVLLTVLWLGLFVWWSARLAAPKDSTDSTDKTDTGLLKRRATLAALGVIAVLGLGALLAGPQFHRVGRSALKPVESLAYDRLDLWQAALELAAEHPLLGSGPDTYASQATRYYQPSVYKRLGANVTARRAHNETLNMLACLGVLGLAAWLWLIGGAVYLGLRTARREGDPDRRLLGMALATALLFGVGFNQLHFITVGQAPWQFALVGMLAGLARRGDPAPRSWTLPPWVRPAGMALGLMLSVVLAWDGLRWLQAERALKRSYVQSLRGRMHAALGEIEEAVQKRPGLRRYLEAKSQLQLRTARTADDVQSARATIEQALAVDRAPLTLWIALAVAKREGDAERVAELGLEAMQRDPTRPRELEDVAAWLLMRGRHDEALALFEPAFVRDPDRAAKVAMGFAAALARKAREPGALAERFAAVAAQLADRARAVESQREAAEELLRALNTGPAATP